MTRAEQLFVEHSDDNHRRTSHVFAVLMVAQWIFAIVVAAVWSPYGWAGRQAALHVHVYTAVFLGGAISSLPLALAILRPSAFSTRIVIAVAQMLWSALLIHLTGGRIETHFHVFGSLAFLAFYRDWRVLAAATIVVVLDHGLRGLLWPDSVYGVGNPAMLRFLEHALWVVFEDVVLVLGCLRGVEETRLVADREAQAEAGLARLAESNDTLDQRVKARTQELSESLERLTETQRQLVDASRRSGMADVATAVLHNVGNVLNSVNISSGMIASTVRESKVAGIGRLRDLLASAELAPMLAGNPKAQQIPAYLDRLKGALESEQVSVLNELDGLQKNIDHIKVIVSMQQTHAKRATNPGAIESLSLATVVNEAVTMAALATEKDIEVVNDFEDVGPAFVDRHKVFQIVVNLLSNARHAIHDTGCWLARSSAAALPLCFASLED